ncbi:hypothetical protein SEA_ESTES_165 [Mycobacterium phage Estes]|uniref:Uncharacterized protein n=1 Tax=Mycobacterium phage Estes TaxID=2759459 RepID=A0A7G9A2L4_9CAUD|nr:hypothetical protein J4U03_gp110 [Mycobacterium phage Estes]QNL30853.1 hypothetical protein SEA_ESTES_165 [Mycobacterium phage Estes]
MYMRKSGVSTAKAGVHARRRAMVAAIRKAGTNA